MKSTEDPQPPAGWTWRDTLNRIQHIDTIINMDATLAIALSVGIITASFFIMHYLKDALLALFLLGLGFSVNLILVKDLARQEYIRKWYFSIFPSPPQSIPQEESEAMRYIFPIMPHEHWLKRDIDNRYSMEEPKPAIIKKPTEYRYILAAGKMKPGHGILCLTYSFGNYICSFDRRYNE